MDTRKPRGQEAETQSVFLRFRSVHDIILFGDGIHYDIFPYICREDFRLRYAMGWESFFFCTVFSELTVSIKIL